MAKKLPPDAFSYYVGLGPSRSYQAVAERYGASKQAVTKLAVRDDWQNRIEAIERKAQQGAEQRAIETLEEMNTRHLKTLRLIQRKALEALASMPLGTQHRIAAQQVGIALVPEAERDHLQSRPKQLGHGVLHHQRVARIEQPSRDALGHADRVVDLAQQHRAPVAAQLLPSCGKTHRPVEAEPNTANLFTHWQASADRQELLTHSPVRPSEAFRLMRSATFDELAELTAAEGDRALRSVRRLVDAAHPIGI